MGETWAACRIAETDDTQHQGAESNTDTEDIEVEPAVKGAAAEEIEVTQPRRFCKWKSDGHDAAAKQRADIPAAWALACRCATGYRSKARAAM